jgi:hypothetical protein
MAKAELVRMKTRPRNPDSASAQGYRYVDKDPVIHELIGLVNKDPRSVTAIAKDAFIAPSTLLALDHGKTRRPQNATIEFLLRSLGKKRKIVDIEPGDEVWRWKRK